MIFKILTKTTPSCRCLGLALVIILTLSAFPQKAYSSHTRSHMVGHLLWYPMLGNTRLDWCFNWGRHCGWQVANRYCKWKGFRRAISFRIHPDIGLTRELGSGAVCNNPTCDGFIWIKCATRYGYPVYFPRDQRGYRSGL